MSFLTLKFDLSGTHHLQGPGQYINPFTDGRDSEGNYRTLLSTQKNLGSVKFAGVSSNAAQQLEGAQARGVPFDPGPGPGQYINPMTYNRGQDGEVFKLKSVYLTNSHLFSFLFFLIILIN